MLPISICKTESVITSSLKYLTGISAGGIKINPSGTFSQGLPFLLKDYLELIDWTGRLIREGKRGSINNELPPILERLSLTQNAWKILTTRFEQEFKQWVGSEHIVQQVYSDKKYQRISSTAQYRTLLG